MKSTPRNFPFDDLFFALYYFQVVLENRIRGEDYDCPFARASIALTKMLSEMLEINGEPRKLTSGGVKKIHETLE